MSVLVPKSLPEFRRPPTVPRSNKSGLTKYLEAVTPNGRRNNAAVNDWEVRTLTMSPPSTIKPPPVVVPRVVTIKTEKKLVKPVSNFPITSDLFKGLPTTKVTSFR